MGRRVPPASAAHAQVAERRQPCDLTEFSAELQLQTLFVLDDEGRITSTREPDPARGPRFSLIRTSTRCAWAVRSDVTDEVAARISHLVRDEPPVGDFQREPVHAERYISILGGRIQAGPAFTFPERIPLPGDVAPIDDIGPLVRHFRGWSAGEIPGRMPIVAVIERGNAISVCFCARRSPSAAEAGVETAEQFRGGGLGSRVTSAWALAVRATGRVPIYSTSWSNTASLGVARKLALQVCANDWSLLD